MRLKICRLKMNYWNQWSRVELDAMHDVVEEEVEEIEGEECLLEMDSLETVLEDGLI